MQRDSVTGPPFQYLVGNGERIFAAAPRLIVAAQIRPVRKPARRRLPRSRPPSRCSTNRARPVPREGHGLTGGAHGIFVLIRRLAARMQPVPKHRHRRAARLHDALGPSAMGRSSSTERFPSPGPGGIVSVIGNLRLYAVAERQRDDGGSRNCRRPAATARAAARLLQPWCC